MSLICCNYQKEKVYNEKISMNLNDQSKESKMNGEEKKKSFDNKCKVGVDFKLCLM